MGETDRLKPFKFGYREITFRKTTHVSVDAWYGNAQLDSRLELQKQLWRNYIGVSQLLLCDRSRSRGVDVWYVDLASKAITQNVVG